ncbi:HET-domain-containing protein [Parathielavia hyrcaniae]|uniref:HET-domain-containing protein n=1 Tax=Parathielavia hyrcaniae TaxID=113614 RepID=A0AAN6PXU9_9PEZI|nr:HET-domain-containing protein [Parathielavia hyrcaniae]
MAADDTLVNPALCDECKNLLSQDFDARGYIYPYFFRFWPTTRDGQVVFDPPGLNGCHLCAIIAVDVFELTTGRRMISPRLKPFPSTPGVNFRVKLKKSVVGAWYELRFEGEADDEEGTFQTRWGTACTVALIPASDRLAARLPAMALEGNSTKNQRSLGIMQSWLQRCRDIHSACQDLSARDNGKESWMPTRLVELIPGFGPEGDLFRVCEGVSLAPYATLSHCWGGDIPTKLQRGTYDVLRAGKPISTLPKTFQEAIMTAKKIGIWYTWIDCLCIIQDSDADEDWVAEAATMADVYRYGTINLSATASENSSQGLYRLRNGNPQGTMPCKLDLRWSCAPHGLYYAVAKAMPYGDDPARELMDKLSKRGWVFQEHMLAPRIVHFSENQLFWQCQTLEASESCPSGPALTTYWTVTRFTNLPSLRYLRLSAETQDLCGYWGTIVEQYTDRNLTRETDRLIALSAIASEAAKIFSPSDTYLAGLWSSYLEQMLLWQSFPGSNQRSSVYVAPTWSWASITGPIRTYWWWKRPDELLARVVGATIEGQVRFGSVSGGNLTLQGYVRKAHVVEDRNSDALVAWSRRTVRLDHSIMFEESLERDTSGNLAIMDVLDRSLISFQIYCLPILQARRSTFGLLLERVGGSEGLYRRVGVFYCDSRFFISEKGEWVDRCCEGEVVII